MVISSDAVRHAARPAAPEFAGDGDAGAAEVDGEAAGADEVGAGALDGEVAGGWVPALDSLAPGVAVAAGWPGPAEPHAATSDVATIAPASHAARRAYVREDLDMVIRCSSGRSLDKASAPAEQGLESVNSLVISRLRRQPKGR